MTAVPSLDILARFQPSLDSSRLLIAHCSLLIAHCSLLIAHWSLLIARWEALGLVAAARSARVASVLRERPSILRSSIDSSNRGSTCVVGTSLTLIRNRSHPLVSRISLAAMLNLWAKSLRLSASQASS